MSTTSSVAEQLLVSELFLHNRGGGSCFIGRDDFQNTQRTRRARRAEQTDNGAPCVQAPLPETQQSTHSLTVEQMEMSYFTSLYSSIKLQCFEMKQKESSRSEMCYSAAGKL